MASRAGPMLFPKVYLVSSVSERDVFVLLFDSEGSFHDAKKLNCIADATRGADIDRRASSAGAP
jgi:hypothetical protein